MKQTEKSSEEPQKDSRVSTSIWSGARVICGCLHSWHPATYQGNQTMLLTYTERGQQRRNAFSRAGNPRTIGARWKERRNFERRNIKHGSSTADSTNLFITKFPYILLMCFAKCLWGKVFYVDWLIGSAFCNPGSQTKAIGWELFVGIQCTLNCQNKAQDFNIRDLC